MTCKFARAMVLFLAMLVIASCVGEDTATRESPVAQKSPAVGTPRASPTAPQAYATEIRTAIPEEVKRVVSGWALPNAFWWDDSRTLYYGGEDAWWRYDVQTDTAQVLEVSPLRPGEPSPHVLDQIPEGALDVVASPSRQRTLYVKGLFPTPTPPPDIDGETEWTSVPSELWLLENGEHHRIGSFEDCVEYYLWSDDEQVIVAQSWALIPCQAHVWLVDLQAPQVVVLIPKEEEYLEAIDLSPSGQRILLRSRESGGLYLWDLSSSSELERLELAQWAWGKWLDERRLVVGENRAADGVRWSYDTFWLYDTQSGERSRILDGREMLEGLEFVSMSLSPDRCRLAFIGGSDLIWTPEDAALWVARINTDDCN
jgi:WD40 repeat protein